ncbi:MAG TPA: hypothetical protein VIP09_16060 [Dehalococcoidia bacterium]
MSRVTTPQCRICGQHVGPETVRYQEIERSPQHYGGRSVGWKCARCRGQVEQGIRAAAKFNQSVKVPPLVGR